MTTSILIFLSGSLTGAATVFIWALRAMTRHREDLARLGERNAHLESLLGAGRDAQEKMRDDFRIAAAEALEKTSAQFVESAIKDLRQVKTEAGQDVEKAKDQIAHSVGEMKERLGEYNEVVKKFENERAELYGRLEKSLGQVLSAEAAIRMETSSLKRVLTASSGVRGQWGERILQEILEQNNLVRGIHYDTQVVVAGDEEAGEGRPDFVIYLPGGKKLVIDSKEVSGEYALAEASDDPDRQKEHLEKLVANIRANFVRLSRKEYQSLLDPDVPFVVMFIPSEAAIRAAFAADPGIFEEATLKKVILASPMTVVPLIYLVAHSWQQQKLARNARDLGLTIEELGNRIFKFMEHLQGMQQSIRKTSEGWNKAIASWQTRVWPQIEKAKELGAKLKDADELDTVETELRQISP